MQLRAGAPSTVASVIRKAQPIVRRDIGAAACRQQQLDYIDVPLAVGLHAPQLRLLMQPLGSENPLLRFDLSDRPVSFERGGRDKA